MAGAVIRVSGEFDDAALKKASAALKKFGMNVESTGKTSGKGFDTLKTKTVALGAAIARVGTDLAYFLGRKAWDTFKGSITAASDFNETLSKTKVIFGENADAIVAYSKTAATAFGQTQTQAMDAASNFAMFGQSAGLSGKDLVGFSTKLTGLASDLASFNNTTVDEAITSLGAALRGESEPIRKYNVLLNDQVLKQEALKQGIIKTTKGALTPQQRVLAAYAVIMKQTKLQQGDFARTSGGLANQQRILAAQIGNLKIQLGQFFLPVITKIVSYLTSKVMPAFTAFADTIGDKLRPVIDALKPAFENLGKVFGGVGKAIVAVIGGITAAFAALQIGTFIAAIAEAGGVLAYFTAEGTALGTMLGVLSGPVGWIALGIAALAATIITAYQTSEDFRDKVKNAFSLVGSVVGSLISIFQSLGDILMKFLAPAWEGIKSVMLGVAQFIVSFMTNALEGLKIAFNWIAAAIERNKEPLSAVTNFFGKLVEIIGAVLRPILSWLGGFLGQVLKAAFVVLGAAIVAAIEIIVAMINVIRQFGEAAIAAKDFAVDAFHLIGGAIDWLWDKFSEFIGKVASSASRTFAPLYDAFKGVVNSIIGAWNQLDFAINIAVPSWVPGIGGKGFHIADIFPDIPYLAEGGIVKSPTLAMIGEAGPEAVIPLSKAGSAGVGGVTVQAGAVVVNIGSLDGMSGSQIQQMVDDAFQRSMTQLARDIRTRR